MSQHVVKYSNNEVLAVPFRCGTNYLEKALDNRNRSLLMPVKRDDVAAGADVFMLFEQTRIDSAVKKCTIYVPLRTPYDHVCSAWDLIATKFNNVAEEFTPEISDNNDIRRMFNWGWIEGFLELYNPHQEVFNEKHLFGMPDHFRPSVFWILLWSAVGLKVRTLDMASGAYSNFVYEKICGIKQTEEINKFHEHQDTWQYQTRNNGTNTRGKELYESYVPYLRKRFQVDMPYWLSLYNDIYNDWAVHVNSRPPEENTRLAREWLVKLDQDPEFLKKYHGGIYCILGYYRILMPEKFDMINNCIVSWLDDGLNLLKHNYQVIKKTPYDILWRNT